MNVLFSPFRPKSLDNVAYESKLKFWTELIAAYLFHKSSPIVSVEMLKAAFQRNGKTPACLGTVIEEFRSIKSLAICSEVNLASNENTLLGWLVKSLVSVPLEWTVSKLKSPFVEKKEPNTICYIHIPVAKKISNEFLAKLDEEDKGQLLTLKEICDKSKLNDEDVKIIIKFLIEEKKAVTAQVGSEVTVKFAKETERHVKLTDVDIGVFQLKKNENLLANNLNKLESDSENALVKVKESMKSGRKQSAKIWLRRKKELDKYIEKRANALENIRCLLDKLKNVESDSVTLQSYQLGIAALKESMSENGLTEERAESTMDELQEVLDVSKEVEETISRPMDDTLDEDLEAELEALLNDQTDYNNTSNNTSATLVFPSVPDGDTDDKKLEARLEALTL